MEERGCKKGQRTGHNLMLSHWVGTTIRIRPEIRFEHGWDRKAYDYGRHQSQLTIACDLIFHY